MGKVIVIMGVSGCGKTTVGVALAAATGGLFFDGDEFHSDANVEKMRSGTPLTDEDREGWLESLRDLIARQSLEEGPVFLACSALKKSHRDILREGSSSLVFVYLKGPEEFIRERLETRRDHYMPKGLLESQFAALELPAQAITVDITRTDDSPVEEVLAALGLRDVSP